MSEPHPQAVLLLWIDAGQQWGWQRNERVGDLRCLSMGFITHEDAESITIAAHWDFGPHFCGGMTIPKVAIVHRKNLGRPGGTRRRKGR